MSRSAEKGIFIASARESLPLAEAIARALARSKAHKFRVHAWWSKQVFPGGVVTINQLLAIPDEVDGAVFVLGQDDRSWYRGDTVSTPRDNVVLEYGIFAARLGLRKSLVVRHPDTRLPTDLEGLSYEPITGDASDVARRVVSHFDKVFLQRPVLEAGPLQVVADPEAAQHQIPPYPQAWRTRACYVGSDGARAWIDLASDPQYEGKRQRGGLRSALRKMLRPLRVRSFVSLGPGDGHLDLEIARELEKTEPLLCYVPVDISEGLLCRALDLVGKAVRAPAGFLADFEERLDYVARLLPAYAPCPRLFGLLGNTFGNLDGNESNFLGGLRMHMRPGDTLLLDVAVARGDEPARKPDIAGMTPQERAFYALGAARKAERPVADILAAFEEAITAEIASQPSDVKGTQVVMLCVAAGQGRVPFAYARRYDEKQLVNWLTADMEFELTTEPRIVSTPDHPYDICLLSLQVPGARKNAT